MDVKEIYKVDKTMTSVACDGGKGALGHPKVYYSFKGNDEVTCGYCGCVFTKKNRKNAQIYKAA